MDKTKLLSLKIRIVDTNKIIALQLNETTIIFDALRLLRENISEANLNDGTFFPVNFQCYFFGFLIN